ncbi:diacylglycerol kinase [Trichonephila clavipes]|nr:diacylglycerol kinase [Trichonephila clavipes]
MMGRGLHLPGNVDDLTQRLEQIWQEIPQETIRVLYHSMPCHVAACIQARDGSTPYSACYLLRIRLNTEVPIQVDGEPWVQSPCEVVVLRSALKATMLRKSKMKRRNTEPVLASTTDKTAPDE